ncbi:shikimate kinase [Bacillus rubiinfantis]|uniref:shikimate kinase n=1 Tax=Bacillus rubiinfantis TaxID=1499680 RepID=UPI0005AAB051|nr:shikimate kinase [Bacillus rubiinfantis]
MDREKSIVLIGFMGVGKTTIGRLLADKLNWTFVDVDDEIEKEFQMPISEIFHHFGEQVFRDREKALITRLVEEKYQIISVGGGAFLQEDIKNLCLATCNVIYLSILFENWQDRLSLIHDSRPVLHGKTLEEIKELFTIRQVIYSQHHLNIAVDAKSPQEVITEILQKGELKP